MPSSGASERHRVSHSNTFGPSKASPARRACTGGGDTGIIGAVVDATEPGLATIVRRDGGGWRIQLRMPSGSPC
jgi:hypothetical protein